VPRNRPRKVQSESDFIPARTSPSGFAAPYHFSISPTCDFAFGDGYYKYTQHPALKRLKSFFSVNYQS